MTDPRMGTSGPDRAPHVGVDRLIEAGVLLRRSLSMIEKGIGGGADETGLSFSQWLVLRALSSNPRMPIGEIGQILGSAGCTATRLIDQLEEMRLVTRQRLSADRRVIGVSLTAKGRRVAALAEPVARDFWSRRTSGISAADMAIFFGVLGQIQSDPEDGQIYPNHGTTAGKARS
jgi:DNA-binding MarR family transcriptional regulator